MKNTVFNNGNDYKIQKKRQFSYLPQFHKKLFLARNGDLKDFFLIYCWEEGSAMSLNPIPFIRYRNHADR